jgi:predicted aldo/keto reductase-like oxidoreductase
MDAEREAGTRGIRYARDKGLAVVAMEPLRGGQLAKEPPAEVREIFEGSVPGRSPAEWGLRWLWDQQEITLVLSGMGSIEQVDENLRVADECSASCLSALERNTIEKAKMVYEARAGVGCTDCRYCMPCPQGVAIPFVFDYFNMMQIYDDLRMAKAHYAFLDEANRANKCTGCGRCLNHCPQHLDIPALLEKIHGVLHGEKHT